MKNEKSPNLFDTMSDDPRNQPRLKPRSRETLGPDHQRIHDGIVSSVRKVQQMSNGALPGPFNAWMYVDSSLTSALDTIGVAIRTETSAVPNVIKSMAVCVVAAHRRCNVAFWAHRRGALSAGLSPETIEAIRCQQDPFFEDIEAVSGNDLRVIYDFVRCYLLHSRVSDEQYQRALSVLGSERSMVQLVLVIGHYCNIAAQLNLLRVPAPGASQPFPPSDD